MPEQDVLEAEDSEARRGVLARAGRIAAVGMAGALAVVSRPTQALAYAYACCNLAKPASSNCPLQCHYYTPAGYHLQDWYCMQGTTRYYCGECTTGSSCGSGTFLCSYYGRA